MSFVVCQKMRHHKSKSTPGWVTSWDGASELAAISHLIGGVTAVTFHNSPSCFMSYLLLSFAVRVSFSEWTLVCVLLRHVAKRFCKMHSHISPAGFSDRCPGWEQGDGSPGNERNQREGALKERHENLEVTNGMENKTFLKTFSSISHSFSLATSRHFSLFCAEISRIRLGNSLNWEDTERPAVSSNSHFIFPHNLGNKTFLKVFLLFSEDFEVSKFLGRACSSKFLWIYMILCDSKQLNTIDFVVISLPLWIQLSLSRSRLKDGLSEDDRKTCRNRSCPWRNYVVRCIESLQSHSLPTTTFCE